MSERELQELQAEVGTLEQFLDELPEERFLERMGFEKRLKKAKARLEELQGVPLAKRLPLTFRGDPVEGSRSIDATFATKAVRSFVEATDMVTASLISEELKNTGPIPNLGQRSLRIVDRALGSFGFELELPPMSPAELDESQPQLFREHNSADPYIDAIEIMFALIKEAANLEEDDEALSELIADIHPGAARKVRDFAAVLVDHNALFAAEFNHQTVRVESTTELNRVLSALKDEDISERETTFKGTILGILPHARTFEVSLDTDEPKIIRGKVDRKIDDIPSFKSQWENQPATLHFRTISVRTKTQYILTGASSR